MLAALVCFSLMALSSRELSRQLDTWQILFGRSLCGTAMLAMLLASQRRWPTLQNLSVHFWRNLSHFAGQYGWFHALSLMSLAQVISIEFTAPLWALLLAPLLVSERLTWPRIISCLLGFIGVLIILQPEQGIEPAAWGMLAAAASYAVAHLLTKKLSHRAQALDILFWMSLMQWGFAALVLAGLGQLPVFSHPLGVLMVSACSLAGHYCLIRAFSLVDALFILPLDFLRLPVLGLCGYWLYQEPITWSLMVGASIILAGNYLNLRAEQRKLGQG